MIDTLLSRLVTISLRELMPTLVEQRISYGFDDRIGGWHVPGPPTGLEGPICEVRAMNCSLHRLAQACVELLGPGGVIGFEAEAEPQPGGGCRLHWRITGQPERRGQRSFEQALDRLQLAALQCDQGTAHGLCPASQAPLALAWRRTGFELNASYRLRRAWRRPEPAPQPFGTRHLWLVQPDAVQAASVAREASRHGWTVSTLPSLEPVLQRLQHVAATDTLPSLLILFAPVGLQPTTLQRLRRLLPRRTLAVVAVETGSLWLGHPDTLPGFEARCHPFSRADWLGWEHTLRALPPMPPSPAARGSQARRPLVRVLVAQHDDVARCLTQSVLQVMGYEVHAARDAVQALDVCLRMAPTVMLLDPALPGPPGEALIARLRKLQRTGLAAPCRIVLHGSVHDGAVACITQGDEVDGFVPQPVDLMSLRSEMRRWCLAHQE